MEADYRGYVRGECASWLDTYLLPLALATADREPAPGLLAALRQEPGIAEFLATEPGSWSAYQREGADFTGNLRIVTVATMLAHWAGDPPAARDARDVIVLLVFRDAYGYACHRDLLGFELGPDVVRALDGFDRWTDLDEPVAEAFAGWMGRIAIDLPTPVSGL